MSMVKKTRAWYFFQYNHFCIGHEYEVGEILHNKPEQFSILEEKEIWLKA